MKGDFQPTSRQASKQAGQAPSSTNGPLTPYARTQTHLFLLLLVLVNRLPLHHRQQLLPQHLSRLLRLIQHLRCSARLRRNRLPKLLHARFCGSRLAGSICQLAPLLPQRPLCLCQRGLRSRRLALLFA